MNIGSIASAGIGAYLSQVQALQTPASSGGNACTAPAGCTPETNPGFPDKPRTDDGAGVHGSQPWYRRGDDVIFEGLVRDAANGADMLGFNNAARHLHHYLDNSGEDLTVDPARIARDVPDFQSAVQQQLDAEVNRVIEQAVADGCYGEPIAFDSGWQGFYIGREMSTDWFLAMGGIQHAVTGTVTVQPGDPPTAQVDYQSHVFDRYNWDEGKETQFGPITISDKRMGDLHTAGLAQEYDIVGSSEQARYTATYNPTGGDTGNPGLPEADDRDGTRTDPGR
ncbi:hypothetical protein [Luteimonas abyssi]|uniref:hypothetical protein n=1 Tax=Luteimonas abyssi TaxID=1247514 RepID=UPI000737B16A|nr:hypothetical protein [Luteimonas abyssi]